MIDRLLLRTLSSAVSVAMNLLSNLNIRFLGTLLSLTYIILHTYMTLPLEYIKSEKKLTPFGNSYYFRIERDVCIINFVEVLKQSVLVCE